MKWGIKTRLAPFGNNQPEVKPFGIPNNSNSHRKSSSPMAPPCHGGCNCKIKLELKGGSKK